MLGIKDMKWCQKGKSVPKAFQKATANAKRFAENHKGGVAPKDIKAPVLPFKGPFGNG